MNHYLYLNDYDSSTDTFSFNMHIFGQQTTLHLIGIFLINKHFFYSIGTFSVNMHLFVQNTHFWSMCTFSFKRHNFSMFLNVYVAQICVTTRHNEKQSTKSQTFQLLYIYIYIHTHIYSLVEKIPWCVKGDYNLYRFPMEHLGTKNFTNAMHEFSDFILVL